MYKLHDYTHVAEQAVQQLQSQPNDDRTWILLVRALANLGRLEEAEHACAAALERRPNAAELWYLHAILLAEAGRHNESTHAARRSIYLDRQFVVAHLALGTALRHIGDLANARLAFANALRILEQLPPGSVVAGADGDTSERIAMAARVQLQLAAEVA
jgi:chemotaxis protein methyltransferase CheR